MWSIEKVKAVGKASFQKNYWKAVLVSFLLSILGLSGGYNYASNQTSDSDVSSFSVNPFGHGYSYHFRGSLGGMISAAVFAGLISLVAIAIVLAIRFFVINPAEIGIRKFFYKNLREQAKIKEVAFGYDHGYRNIVRILFFRDLYVFLWTLLFIIPGIVKAYEYMMIPYLLSEHPEMTKEEAFAESRRMMDGEKWNAFVMDLSFIGWWLLSMLTAGIFGIFYTNPYMNQTHAALYDALKILKPRPVYQQPQGYGAQAQPDMASAQMSSAPAEPPVQMPESLVSEEPPRAPEPPASEPPQNPESSDFS